MDPFERLVDRNLFLVGDGGGAHRPSVSQPQDKRARVDLLEPDQPVVGEPVSPFATAELTHQCRLRM